MPEITFIEDRKSVCIPVAHEEQTLLEASLAHGIPHYHSCGGLARCSTCRVYVIEGLSSFGPRSAAEAELAGRGDWPESVRLACQSRPTAPAKVRRIVFDQIDADLAEKGLSGWPAPEERDLAILFCDIDGFTSITENQLAFDVVHSLNRFFRQVGDPILANGGVINRYMGDGLLALFGVNGGSREECSLQAIRASLRMLSAVRTLNIYLQEHFGFSFELRIGLHYGRVVVGQIGHPEKVEFTVVGDAVNAASRIEGVNKGHGTQLLASEDLVGPVLASLQIGQTIEEILLRGRLEPLHLYEIIGFREVDPVFLLQSTFEQIAPEADAFAQSFYERLFGIAPKLQPLFANTDMVIMRRMLMRMIAVTVRGLPGISPQLRELGARHTGYGVRPEYYAFAIEALLGALQKHLGSAFVPEVEKAWTGVLHLIRDTMLDGASSVRPDETPE
jgi:class 3 adenylate cyclase/hemoglobin-like flavoprotein